jgi:hypothetical protein
MITVSIAFIVGVGVFAVIWRIVARGAVRSYGENAAMTFTPPE